MLEKRRKWLCFCLLLVLLLCGGMPARAKTGVGGQLWKNFHLSWDISRTDDYRWRNFSLGSGYGLDFGTNNQAYWLVGMDFNWSKYTLYSDGVYSMGADNVRLKTTSLSFPAVVGYRVYEKWSGNMKVYTGPVLETILSSYWDGRPYDEVQNMQLGWTVGTKIRFWLIFSARLAYSYYPTGLFRNGDLNRSNVTFSLGF
jgi:hypothetical protein